MRARVLRDDEGCGCFHGMVSIPECFLCRTDAGRCASRWGRDRKKDGKPSGGGLSALRFRKPPVFVIKSAFVSTDVFEKRSHAIRWSVYISLFVYLGELSQSKNQRGGFRLLTNALLVTKSALRW